MQRRTLVLSSLILAAVAGVLLVLRLNAHQEYRRLLTDGERLLEAGHAPSAADAFSAAIALRPGSMAAHYRRGEAFAAEGRHQEALRDLMEARRLTPEASLPLEALGRLADRRGQPAEAANWYAQAIERLRVADARLLYALALARYRAGSPAAAREPLKEALSRDADMAEAHYLLGLVSRDARQLADAALSLEQAVRLDPGLVAAREELSDLYRERGMVADELVQLRALAAADRSTDRYLAVALACLRARRFTDAIAAINQAEAVGAGDSRIALTLGRVHLARAEDAGDRTQVRLALAALERALGGTARRSEGLALYGRALYLSGDVAGAERLLQDAILTSPVDPEAFGFLADAAEHQGHPAMARDALLKLDALEGDTVSSDVRATRARRIGALALSAGDAPLGVEHLEAAVRAGIADAATLGLLARARFLAGDAPGARAALGQALALDANNPELRRIERTTRQGAIAR